jgi:hypothetical protein
MKSPYCSAMGLTSIRLLYTFCACSMQNTPVVPKYSRATFAQNKKFYTQNVLLGLFNCDATSPYKKLVKNWENALSPACDP